jgi:hypothetical protein
MKPSEIKLLTQALEAKGHNVHKGKDSWNEKVRYSVIYHEEANPNVYGSRSVELDFAPSDNKNIAGLLLDYSMKLLDLEYENKFLEVMIKDKFVDTSKVHLAYIAGQFTLEKFFHQVQSQYMALISKNEKSIAIHKRIVADLQEILESSKVNN